MKQLKVEGVNAKHHFGLREMLDVSTLPMLRRDSLLFLPKKPLIEPNYDDRIPKGKSSVIRKSGYVL